MYHLNASVQSDVSGVFQERWVGGARFGWQLGEKARGSTWDDELNCPQRGPEACAWKAQDLGWLGPGLGPP